MPSPSITAIWPCRDVFSSLIDGAKSSFESALSTMTASPPAASQLPPRSILNHTDREKVSKQYRTTFTLPSGQVDDSDGDHAASNPKIARRSLPVLPAAADAAVAQVGRRPPYRETDPADSWRTHPASNTPRFTFEWPVYTPAGSSAGWSQSPHSGGATSTPASPMGAPPGPPSAVDFEDWWTPDMVRERNQRH